MSTFWSKASTPLAIGFGAGSCVLLMVAGALLASRLNLPLAATPTAVATATSAPTEIAIPTITSTETTAPVPSVADLLRQAENSIADGNPEEAEALILPGIETWLSSENKAEGYSLLGDAEASKGHFRLATPYYEKAYFYQPTPDNLFNIAVTEDMGGDLCNAFKHYQELNSWVNANGSFDRDFVKSRIEDIGCKLGTQVP